MRTKDSYDYKNDLTSLLSRTAGIHPGVNGGGGGGTGDTPPVEIQ